MMVCCYVCCYVSGGVCVLDLYCYLVLMFRFVGFVVVAVLCSACICYLLFGLLFSVGLLNWFGLGA